jgi:cephalosporin hydroxylase
VADPAPRPVGPDREIVDRFHELYYSADYKRTVGNTFWRGVMVAKCPLDLWVYQEILHERRPDVIVETGTFLGGSAYFMASICDLLDSGRVITIDVKDRRPERLPQHPRIEYRTGSSVEPEVVTGVRESIGAGERVMVVLDSNHHHHHVIAELRAYAPLVTEGDYLIVEDTNVNGHPIRPDHGPGPMEAVDDFLAECEEFEIDPAREKFYMTFNPRGYLRRSQPAGPGA